MRTVLETSFEATADQFEATAASMAERPEYDELRARRVDVLLAHAESLRAAAARVRRMPAGGSSDQPYGQPKFQVGEFVLTTGVDDIERTATVIKVYPRGQGWRYVLHADDGKEQVLFESELLKIDVN